MAKCQAKGKDTGTSRHQFGSESVALGLRVAGIHIHGNGSRRGKSLLAWMVDFN